jgi:alanyl-tRNA synthetase
MAATVRLYYDDPLLLAFDARVSGLGELGGRPTVILDRSAFYPESGGQMADHGTLGGLPVTDVQVDDAGVVHHLVEGTPPPVGAEVGGVIDRSRRRLHMALHTGQHMLSRALVDVARGETVSARLGETLCTIDLGLPALEERTLAEAEALVNAVVDDDVGIRSWFPAPGELASLPLRREPKVDSNVRVVQIGQFDVSPCGGTHCLSSAQVGLVKVVGLERYKGMMRVSFQAGRRAREELGQHSDLLRVLGREMTCGPIEVRTAIEKLRRELSATRDSLGGARARLAEVAAQELAASAGEGGGGEVVATFDDADAGFLRVVAKRLNEAGLLALLAARTPEALLILAARPAASDFDCGAFIKRLAAAHGGRGGGRVESAEGRLPSGADWAQAVAGARA